MDSAKNRKHASASASASSGSASCSVIVPAFRENANLRPLVTRLFQSFSSHASSSELGDLEVIIVDDNSRDGSVETVQMLQSTVQCSHRRSNRRTRTLLRRGEGIQRGSGRKDDLHGCGSSTSSRSCSFAFARTQRSQELRPGHALRRRCGDGQGLAAASTNHLERRKDARASTHLGLRPHVRLLWHHKFGIQECRPQHQRPGLQNRPRPPRKSGVPNSAIAEIPFSFGIRKRERANSTAKS